MVEHISESSRDRFDYPFYNAIRKYGKDCIKWEILESDISDIESLNKREIFWIKEKNTLSPNGYNLTTGGNHYLLSEQSKKKISNSRKGIKLSKETKEKLRIFNLGKTLSKEHREKMSEAHKGEKNHFFGKHHTKESNLKNRLSHLNKKHSDETKNKISECSRLMWERRKKKEGELV